jgi:HK97 family phage portal protein
MRILGFDISRTKAAPPALANVDSRRGWWPMVKESFTGAWQQNVEVRRDDVLASPAAFRCISVISSDIAKMRLRLVRVDDGVWSEAESPAFSPVLREPNRYQTRLQFIESWMVSKLVHGNTFVLKVRDDRKVVVALHVLDPTRVTVLVAPDGSVWYRLTRDDLANMSEDEMTVPATEIIHDRWNTFYHPLVGLSPIYASGLAATVGQNIQNFSAKFFRNSARPGGMIVAPDEISDADADRLKAMFEQNYGGDNVGRIAVLGSGLEFKSMNVTAADSQMLEQMKWSGETVCSVFGVPAYKAGIGDTPTYDNVSALNQKYYDDCLHIHVEAIEACLDKGLALPSPYGTEFDTDDLLRMDVSTQIKTLSEAVKGGLMKPNEARRKLSLAKVAGGDAVYLQQQNYSLEALAKRDAKDDPFASASRAGAAAGTPAANASEDPPPDDSAAEEAAAEAVKELPSGRAQNHSLLRNKTRVHGAKRRAA